MSLSQQKPLPALESRLNASDNNQKQSHVLTMAQNISSRHYATKATIIDQPLVLIVDAGASVVTLPEAIAHNADIIYCEDFEIGMNAVNGFIEACAAKIKKLQFCLLLLNMSQL